MVENPAFSRHNMVLNLASDSRHMPISVSVPGNGGRGRSFPSCFSPSGGLAAGKRAGHQVQIHSANRWVKTQTGTRYVYYWNLFHREGWLITACSAGFIFFCCLMFALATCIYSPRRPYNNVSFTLCFFSKSSWFGIHWNLWARNGNHVLRF